MTAPLAAPRPRVDPVLDRMLVVGVGHRLVRDLPELLDEGDLVVVNDAATLPASVPGRGPRGETIEWRLAAHEREGAWWAVAFGAGDWRTDTDLRPAPPPLSPGDAVVVATTRATVEAVSPVSPRLVLLRTGPEDVFVDAVYRWGRPVQYRYLAEEVALEDVQTAWGGRPWAVEAPSAAFPVRWRVLDALAARGVRVATVTEAAGLSATGDPALDAALPLPERYEVPAATIGAVLATKARGRRVLAIGTSAVRALESAARGPSSGTTSLVLGSDTDLKWVDALLSNVHGPGESHFRLMTAFADEATLAAGYREAVASGYLAHEFGDALLVGLTRG